MDHLYIHIPFCRRRCDYCDFFSQVDKPESREQYVGAVLAEAAAYGDELTGLETVYIGGGTPTLLEAEKLELLLTAVRVRAGGGAEITIEANPATIDGPIARLLKDGGANRISLGVQSFDRRLRENLGRSGGTGSIGEAYDHLRRAGFDNIGLDLVFGIPGQGLDDLRTDLQKSVALEPEHISYYELAVKDGSDYQRRWAFELAAAGRQGADFYEVVVGTLEDAGYTWYETSNFALPGRECRHNIAYWQGKDYIGLGAGAWSTVGLRRWRNVEDVNRYMEEIDAAGTEGKPVELLTERQKQSEKMVLGLRMAAGVPRDKVEGVMDRDEAGLMRNNGILVNEGGKILLTRRGRMVADEVCARLLRE